MSAPDVTVVVAVYNTMPYLTKCLTSLVKQSIGRERLEIIAVDDGSTDGSGKELDRFARAYPDTVKVIHQANSGGPAAPSNRALEQATGRYVFFIGADDYLGREALERLVAAADRYGSDVVLGKTVGVNSRHIYQAVFARTEAEIGLFDSALPWSLSNTKLFRRELIERHKLRYPEDMPVGSDQPFTIEACYRAKRISVLADYDYYYAVRRLNARNITYHSRHEERLRCAESLVHFVAGLIEPGRQRDAVLLRHFSWEVAKLLEDDFLRLDREVQQRVQGGIGRLVEQYLTDDIRTRLAIEARLRLLFAQRGDLDDLLSLIRQDAKQGVPSTVIDGDRWYAAYPGFRDPRLALPDSWFDVTDSAADWLAKLDVTSAVWGAEDGVRALTVTARSPRPDLAELCSGPITMTAGPVTGKVLGATSDDTGTVVRARFRLDELLAEVAPGGELRPLRIELTALGRTGSAPVRAPWRLFVPRQVQRRGARFYLVTPTTSHKGQFVISVVPFTPRRVMARLRRRWRQGGK
ncbi:MAG TPA: glycosyltransferase family 2 protein [Micromonosporaceae bacterium]|nr:glycosyltransferase family 2 protein [Micromonosporaceae bacterium]